MFVVNDIEEPFLPQPEDLLISLGENRDRIDNLLTQLPKMFVPG